MVVSNLITGTQKAKLLLTKKLVDAAKKMRVVVNYSEILGSINIFFITPDRSAGRLSNLVLQLEGRECENGGALLD